jgi:GATA-binding protein, other eukaryote
VHSGIAPPHLYDPSHTLSEHHLLHSPSLPALHLRHPSPGSVASLVDRHLEPPQSYDALQQSNTSLKTRVSELEVINGLFKGRVHELERAESMQRQALEQSQARETDLRRRLEELERQVLGLRRDTPPLSGSKRRLDIDADLSNPRDESPPYAKRIRIPDAMHLPEPIQPRSA